MLKPVGCSEQVVASTQHCTAGSKFMHGKLGKYSCAGSTDHNSLLVSICGVPIWSSHGNFLVVVQQVRPSCKLHSAMQGMAGFWSLLVPHCWCASCGQTLHNAGA